MAKTEKNQHIGLNKNQSIFEQIKEIDEKSMRWLELSELSN